MSRELPSPPARPGLSPWGPVGVTLALALALGACSKDKPDKPESKDLPGETKIVPFDESSPYHVVQPNEVEPLEALYFPEPSGPGYDKVPVEVGASIHSGKWLALAQGDARFLGPKHMVVNHYDQRPKSLHAAKPAKSALIDVESGEPVVEFEHGRRAQWQSGLALVYKHDDDAPYLLDVESTLLVPALPAGEHDYVLGENYWIRLSPIARRVWVLAVDGEKTPHLYEWENLSKPPPLPDNPAPMLPRLWDPKDEAARSSADSEEIWAQSSSSSCIHAILVPPRGFDCLDEDLPEGTEPLSGGWRADPVHKQVLERGTDEGFDFGSLCSSRDAVELQVLERSPPHVRVTCQDDPRTWMLWTPQHGVRKMDPERAALVNEREMSVLIHDDLGKVELRSADRPSSVLTRLDAQRGVRELVSDGLDCAEIQVRAEASLAALGCRRGDGSFAWFELEDFERKVRGRVDATSVAVSQSGLAVGIVRRGGRDHLVPLTLGSP